MDDIDVRTEIQRAASALGEPKRFDLVCRLFPGERTVGELAIETGMTQPLVSHHLAVLRRAGLVVVVSDGRFHRYSLQPGTSPAIRGILDLIDRLVLHSRGRESAAAGAIQAGPRHSPQELPQPDPGIPVGRPAPALALTGQPAATGPAVLPPAPPAPGEMEDFLL